MWTKQKQPESPTKQRIGLRTRLGLKRSKRDMTGGDTYRRKNGDDAPPTLRSDGYSSDASSSSTSERDDTRSTASTTEVVLSSPTHSPTEFKRRRSSTSIESTDSDKSVGSTSSRKGVSYNRDGSIVCCRFCEILRSRDAEFVYEEEAIAVFRPLYPVSDSHVLVVPRCHIRNIKMLTQDHSALLQRMREVAEKVLRRDNETSSSPQPIEATLAFHTPPFNSIDHVHMHAFRKHEGSCGLGAIKYKTETWWCRSFDEVLARVVKDKPTTPSSSSSSSSSSSASHGLKTLATAPLCNSTR